MNPEPELFTQFLPFRPLATCDRILLAGVSEVREVPPGRQLADLGDNSDDEFFLLDGRVSAINAQGEVVTLQAGTANSAGALAAQRPRQVQLVTDTTVRLLVVPRALVLAVQNQTPAAPDPSHAALDLRKDSDRILATISKSLRKHGELKLPVSRQGAAFVRNALAERVIPAPRLAQLAMVEPSLSLRLIAAANHSLFFAGPAVQSVHEAVARLGAHTTRRMLRFFTESTHVPDRASPISLAVHQQVLQSRELAWLCAQLAERTPPLTLTRAYQVGLLGALGDLAILGAAEQEQALCLDVPRLQRCLEQARLPVARALLRAAGLGKDFLQAAEHAGDWLHNHGHDADYSDVLVVAQLHAAIGTPAARQMPVMGQVPAFARVAEGALQPQDSLDMINMAREHAQRGEVFQTLADHRVA